MVPALRTIMNSSYYYEYRYNIHLGVELTPASLFGILLLRVTSKFLLLLLFSLLLLESLLLLFLLFNLCPSSK